MVRDGSSSCFKSDKARRPALRLNRRACETAFSLERG